MVYVSILNNNELHIQHVGKNFRYKQTVYMRFKLVNLLSGATSWYGKTNRKAIFMIAVWNRADQYIFALWFLLSSSFFFPGLISAVGVCGMALMRI